MAAMLMSRLAKKSLMPGALVLDLDEVVPPDRQLDLWEIDGADRADVGIMICFARHRRRCALRLLGRAADMRVRMTLGRP